MGGHSSALSDFLGFISKTRREHMKMRKNKWENEVSFVSLELIFPKLRGFQLGWMETCADHA